jgi:hypothetical protein
MHEAKSGKAREAFGKPRADGHARAARGHVPVEDALARMAGKIGERRRAAEDAAAQRQ